MVRLENLTDGRRKKGHNPVTPSKHINSISDGPAAIWERKLSGWDMLLCDDDIVAVVVVESSSSCSVSLGGVEEARCACACFSEAGEVLERFAHTPTTRGGCFGSGGLELNTWFPVPPRPCSPAAPVPLSPFRAVLESDR
uniref:Uncharacterized protein n=1 Tax=Anopheles culicifacies TaxID=139723 RepID=A0A182MUM7_9DIPT